MPHVDSELIGKTPVTNALGVFHKGVEAGSITPLPPGVAFAIIDQGEVIPLVLLKVDKKQLVFRCICGKANCNRKVKFTAKWTGHHPGGELASAR